MDFSKYNKGLHVFATLICNNIDIFNTNSFINLYTDCDIYNNIGSCIYLLYDDKLYDNYIINLLRSSSSYFKDVVIIINKISYHLFIFKINKDKLDLYNRIKYTGSVMLTKNEILETCILWKKYLDDSFIEMFNFWTCEQCLKTKG